MLLQVEVESLAEAVKPQPLVYEAVFIGEDGRKHLPAAGVVDFEGVESFHST
jgi:hypothetical protein